MQVRRRIRHHQASVGRWQPTNRLQATGGRSSLPRTQGETAHAAGFEGGVRARPAARERYRARHVAWAVRTQADERPPLAMAGAGAAAARYRGDPRLDAARPGHANF